MIIKKNDHSQLIIDEFFKTIDFDNNLITDYYLLNNESSYEESILSLLFKIYGSIEINDPYYFGWGINGIKNIKSKKYPFLQTKLKGPTKEQALYQFYLLCFIRKSKSKLII